MAHATVGVMLVVGQRLWAGRSRHPSCVPRGPQAASGGGFGPRLPGHAAAQVAEEAEGAGERSAGRCCSGSLLEEQRTHRRAVC